MKDFEFIYKQKTKYGDSADRTLKVSIPRPTGNIGIDAKAALNVFIASVGNLKKYDIVEIWELDSEGKHKGLPITPNEESTVVPLGKKAI